MQIHKQYGQKLPKINTIKLEENIAEKRSVSVNELNTDDLFWIFGEAEYSHPKCLKVFKWTKG